METLQRKSIVPFHVGWQPVSLVSIISLKMDPWFCLRPSREMYELSWWILTGILGSCRFLEHFEYEHEPKNTDTYDRAWLLWQFEPRFFLSLMMHLKPFLKVLSKLSHWFKWLVVGARLERCILGFRPLPPLTYMLIQSIVVYRHGLPRAGFTKDEVTTIGSLVDFQSLSSLAITADLLLGPQTPHYHTLWAWAYLVDPSPWNTGLSLSQYLPTSIKDLTLYECGNNTVQ